MPPSSRLSSARPRSPAAAAAIRLGRDSAVGEQLVVSAAASLEPAFTAYADRAGIDARQSFAGSDDLAAQIRQGVTPDVYAAANTSLPDDLYKDGLRRQAGRLRHQQAGARGPGRLATIDSIDDLDRARTSRSRSATKGVPVGDYTREVLDRLPAAEREAILANVGSEEPDVAGIVGKLTQGAVDAGFVYVTDVVATDGAARGDRRCRRGCSPRSPTASPSSRAPRTRAGPRTSSTACSTAEGADALADAGFGPPTRRLTVAASRAVRGPRWSSRWRLRWRS